MAQAAVNVSLFDCSIDSSDCQDSNPVREKNIALLQQYNANQYIQKPRKKSPKQNKPIDPEKDPSAVPIQIPMQQALSKFGITKLKDKQQEIVKHIQDKKDVLAILPTGYGKSITYLIHYFLTNKTILVVSPLIALMEDQHNSLKEKDIPTIMLNQVNESKRKDINTVLQGNPHIVFTSPEYLVSNSCEAFVTKLVAMDALALIAIDESHLISTWRVFRPQYGQLSCINEWAPNVPKLAVTATATPAIIECIIETLQMEDPVIVKASFQRHNLVLSTQRKTTLRNDIHGMVDKINQHTGKTIIYCKSKRETESIANHLQKNHVPCKHYHAGMDMDDRKQTQEEFTSGVFSTMTATVAFGMGVDIPDIRLVMHYSMPKSIESLYQEMGRAGRDGLESQCCVYWAQQDVTFNRQLVESSYDIEELNQTQSDLQQSIYDTKQQFNTALTQLRTHRDEKYKDNKKTLKQRKQAALEQFETKLVDIQYKIKVYHTEHNNITAMEQYCCTIECRMAYICKYFVETIDKCNKCENCTKVSNHVDIGAVASMMVSTLQQANCGLGVGTMCDLLRGKKTKYTEKWLHLNTKGACATHKIDALKHVITDLKMKKFLKDEKLSRFITIIKLTPMGEAWQANYLRTQEPLFMVTKLKLALPSASAAAKDPFDVFDDFNIKMPK